jgi:undecaprenyl-diphosphatase
MLAVLGVVVAASVGLFLLIAEDRLEGGGFIRWDHAVLNWFVDHRTDLWVSASKSISNVGSFLVLLLVGIVLAAVLWRRGKGWALPGAPVVAICLASLTSTIAKAAFDRPRPPIATRATSAALAAFPSGHATHSAAFFLSAALVLCLTSLRTWRSQILLLTGAAALAGLVGISRLVLAVHWLSDVVAGLALGTAVAVITVTAVCWTTSSARLPPDGSARTATET